MACTRRLKSGETFFLLLLPNVLNHFWLGIYDLQGDTRGLSGKEHGGGHRHRVGECWWLDGR